MPRWTIRCTKCGIEHEQVFRSVEERDKTLKVLVCDEPCFAPFEVVPSSANFVLKGSGFHCNDYRGVK